MNQSELTLWFFLINSFICFTHSAYIFGYMLHNPVPGDQSSMDSDNLDHELATLELPSSDGTGNNNATISNTTRILCTKNDDCNKTDQHMYCDSHYGYCDVLHAEMELCRRDEQCDKGLICLFGKCHKEPRPRSKGSRCKIDSDCDPHHCCARQHGEKICKPMLSKGQRCYVPTGGLDYSLNELCPCDTGLVCTKRKRKNERNSNNIRNRIVCAQKRI